MSLKRTQFKRPELPPREKPQHKPIRQLAERRDDGKARLSVPCPKTPAIRSEKYLALIRKMRCAHCGIDGYTQAAHADGIGHTGVTASKGGHYKVDDRFVMALCAAHIVTKTLLDGRPETTMVAGCHSDISSGKYSKAERRELELKYVKRAIAAVLNAQLWPKDLPMPDESMWSEA